VSPFFSEFFGGTRFRESEKRSIDFSATPVNAYESSEYKEIGFTFSLSKRKFLLILFSGR